MHFAVLADVLHGTGGKFRLGVEAEPGVEFRAQPFRVIEGQCHPCRGNVAGQVLNCDADVLRAFGRPVFEQNA